MAPLSDRIYWGAVCAVMAGTAVGAWILLSPPKPSVTQETPAPAVWQADGSLVLERAPDPQAKPAQEMPKGAKVERVIKVTVKPKTQAATAFAPGLSAKEKPFTLADCPPVTVDLTMVKDSGGHRVIASSPDGDVIAGKDIPITAFEPSYTWAAGLSIDPIHRTPGIRLERDWSRLRIGIDAYQTQRRDIETRLFLGWRF